LPSADSSAILFTKPVVLNTQYLQSALTMAILSNDFALAHHSMKRTQWRCTGKEWDTVGKSSCVPVPSTTATKTPSPVLSTTAYAGEAHGMFEINYSKVVISLVFMQQLTTCLF